MNDNLVDWLMADSWQDYQQQRAIRALDSELTTLGSSLAAQRRESGLLRSQLAKLQGTLEERVNRLTRAFDAFVELSDLRMTLALFDPPALIRHRTRQILADPTSASALGDFADVPGYWLGPALRAHIGADATALSEALARDPVRSALFLTIAPVVTGGGGTGLLAQALGSLPADQPLTHAQRVLWIAAAEGTFGDAGRTLLEARLAEFVTGLPPEREAAMAEAWAERVARLSAPGLSSLGGPTSMGGLATDLGANTTLSAAARLRALRTLCEAPPGDEPAPPTLALGEVLRSLVDEGSVEEAAVIRRVAELRAVIENRSEPDGLTWDAPAGSAADLLSSDAFDSGTGVRGELARAAGARWILAAAEGLADQAAADPPEEARITVSRVTVRVRANSENTNALAEVRAEVERRYPEPAGLPVPTIALAAVGVLLCLAVFAWPNGLAILAVLVGIGLLVTAGVRWQRARRAEAERKATREAELQHAQRQIEKAAEGLSALRARVEDAAKQAADDLAALRASLSR